VTAEKVVTSVCYLLSHFKVFEDKTCMHSLRGLHNYVRLVELLAEWSADDNKVVAPTLAALLAVDDSREASEAVERNWAALAKAQAVDVVEVLCRRPEFAVRALEHGLLIPEKAQLELVLSSCLSLPKNELVWELADWVYRSNAPRLRDLLKIDKTVAK